MGGDGPRFHRLFHLQLDTLLDVDKVLHGPKPEALSLATCLATDADS